MRSNQTLLQTAFAKLWSTPALNNGIQVTIKDNPADAGTRGMPAEFLKLSSWIKGPHLLTKTRFPFVKNKGVNNNIKLGVNQAVSMEDTSLATIVKKQTTPATSLISFGNFNSYRKNVTRELPHAFSNLYRNMPATVTSSVALLTLLRMTKPSIISSTWRSESLLKPTGGIFMTINRLNGAAELLHIHCSLVEKH